MGILIIRKNIQHIFYGIAIDTLLICLLIFGIEISIEAISLKLCRMILAEY